ncbi:branched-chain amino acid ABC transporter permease [Deinococcus sp. KSM4-11]|nr:branched-chain amino acid ABC transporter permease [Deinococcus sp. KSM4-11]
MLPRLGSLGTLLKKPIVEAFMVSLFLANILFAYLWRAAPWAKLLVGIGSLIFVLPFAGKEDASLLDLSISIMIFAALALGLNIVVGLAGLLDLGYIAFFAVGAYTWGIVASPRLGEVLKYYGGHAGAAATPTLAFGVVLLLIGGALFTYLRRPGNTSRTDSTSFLQAGALVVAAFLAMLAGRAIFTQGDTRWSMPVIWLGVIILLLPLLAMGIQRLRGHNVLGGLHNYKQFLTGLLAVMGVILVVRSIVVMNALKADGLATGINPGFFWLFLALSIMAAATVGVLIGLPVLKLKGDYLAIITLGLGEVIRVLANNLGLYTGGSQGINGIKSAPVPWFDKLAGLVGFTDDQFYLVFLYFVVIAMIGIILTVNIRLDKSRIGRAWIAIRDDEIAAQAMGVPLMQTKLIAFATGASFAGVMGMIFAAKQQFIDPTSFILTQSIGVLSMVILGGMGSFPGVILGATVVTLLNLRILPGLGEQAANVSWIPQQVNPGQLQRLIFGVILVTMMLLRPEGLLPSRRRTLELHHEGNQEDDSGHGSGGGLNAGPVEVLSPGLAPAAEGERSGGAK